MATKLSRKIVPAGYTPNDFKYQGAPSSEQGEFGSHIGIADMACVNQIGEANNAKYYHGGVVQSTDGKWWVYLEWGRMKAAHSWNGGFNGGDFMFVQCTGEDDARSFFEKQMNSKNMKRLTQRLIGGKTIWTAASGSDGYLVQRLATRVKGLPDAYTIKDGTGVAPVSAPITPAPAPTKKSPAKKANSKTYQSQVIELANALVGGTRTYTRSMAAAAGVTPTLQTIEEVRNDLIPLALGRIAQVGNDISDQVTDPDLVALSKMVSALVPRPIPGRGLSDSEAILNANNILVLQQDLDAFESALAGEDFSVSTTTQDIDPATKLNADLEWIDPRSDLGQWVIRSFASMTNNRHSYIRGNLRVRNVFAVYRSDRDRPFHAAVKTVAARRKGNFSLRANMQPSHRMDIPTGMEQAYADSNTVLAIHGTRPVNIAPILGTNFRLPKSLPGAQITGANFGHGIYFATDFKKSYGYTGRGYWGHGGGDVQGRGCFMFLCDMLMGDAYRAPRTGSWNTPPDGKDSVFGVGGDRGHSLENDEHVIFNPHYQSIRYIVELDWFN